MTGLGVLLRKELLEQWRTLRLPVVATVFLLVGLQLAAPRPVHAGDPQGASAATSSRSSSRPPTAADAFDQLAKNLGQFGGLIAILLAMGVRRDREGARDGGASS